MSGYLTAPWSDFSVAVVGASAALTGSLFVAVSITIEQILAVGTLAGRALSTMILFVVPLVAGILLLVPEQSRGALGLELIGTGLVAGGGRPRVGGLSWLRTRGTCRGATASAEVGGVVPGAASLLASPPGTEGTRR